jgi:hypothetical protein
MKCLILYGSQTGTGQDRRPRSDDLHDKFHEQSKHSVRTHDTLSILRYIVHKAFKEVY